MNILRALLLVSLCAIAAAQIKTSSCTLSLPNVGTLPDGQLRYNFGRNAINVTFTLDDSILTSSIGKCYVSYAQQVQCDSAPQRSPLQLFSIVDGLLAFNGSTGFFLCPIETAYNIYNTQFYPQCTAVTLPVSLSNCTQTQTLVKSSSAVLSSAPSSANTPAAETSAAPVTPAATRSDVCLLSLNNVGSLTDGQLRLGFGTGAQPVLFNLTEGRLTSSLGLVCYISAQTQIQCNSPPQTTETTQFSIVDGLLAWDGSTALWECDAGTGGSNLYTTKFYSQCQPATIRATSQCTSSRPQVSGCQLSIQNLGSLSDGQLRLGFGTGAVAVTFNLTDGQLTSSLGLQCYISAQTQIQCNSPPQTTETTQFSIVDGLLAWDGSNALYCTSLNPTG